jgi:hypothetical protein
MFVRRFRALALLALPALFVACDVGDECSPLACESGIWIKAAPSGAWQPGDYELSVTHDGETEKCNFSLPYDIPTSTLSVYLTCGKAVRASLTALSDCTACTIDDAFELSLFLNVTPEDLSVELKRGEDVALSDERTVEYTDEYPRGKECGGGCRQAKYDLVVDQ